MTYAIFDVETRIDKALVRAVYCPDEAMTDDEAYEHVRQRLEAEQRSDFFPVSFHVPISIAWGRVSSDLGLTAVETLVGSPSDGAALAGEFWTRVESLQGTLVSFNGRGFDLPVLELQALRHGIEAPRYFNERHGPRSRYSEQHYDLYDFITNAGMYRVRGGLDLLAKLIGLPGKTAVRGAAVQGLWEAGQQAAIDRYCRHDVIQTYFLLLRVERTRGHLTAERLDSLWHAAEAWRRELEGERLAFNPPSSQSGL